ncbi:uncharacterized protein LOC142343042 [Convolutriloba macropyga]|uniref:uncharacterized protein LOC142343042 n=1 Tax=Convolutriloba macropyga TaxID=536237 RepID=UPI003F527F2E
MGSKIPIIVLLIGCFIRGCFFVRARSEWESLVFMLSDNSGNSINQKCAQLSTQFCTFGFTLRARHRRPHLRRDFEEVFVNATRRIYASINWFSFDSHEFGGCCDFQKTIYEEEGAEKGLSPLDYHARIMDFFSHGKQLNFLSTRSDEYCGNVVAAIGFGTGPFSYSRLDDRLIKPKTVPSCIEEMRKRTCSNASVNSLLF